MKTKQQTLHEYAVAWDREMAKSIRRMEIKQVLWNIALVAMVLSVLAIPACVR